jgi:CheY-like chemotaxis protein
MRILVAEDDAVSLLVIRRAGEKLGHECLGHPAEDKVLQRVAGATQSQ